jgi:hypothetical protein
MQEADSARRIAILRGETPPPLEVEDVPRDEQRYDGREIRAERGVRERKKRKRAGENDTDFEMRVAKERRLVDDEEGGQAVVLRKPGDAPLHDEKGHISLFSEPKLARLPKVDPKSEKEAADLAKRKAEYERDYTVKFSDAAGFKTSASSAPWYSSGKRREGMGDVLVDEVPGKDAWGNEDPRRKEREAHRMVSNDPLAMIKMGARKAKEVALERRKFQEQLERERAGDMDDEDELESFSLDAPASASKHRHVRERSSRSQHESSHRSSRHRSKSRERSRRHRSRSRERSRRHRSRSKERSHRHRQEHDRSRSPRRHRSRD